jgi:release factor glutamine methyltransferase
VSQRYLDLCCGSGIIAITVALERGRHFQQMVATDISAEALAVCRRNCVCHGVDSTVLLVQADLTAGIAENHLFTLITSNPPYVSRSEMADGMQQEVIGYEPHLALDGGEEGLDKIGEIIGALPGMLAPGGDFFMEIGADQASAVQRMFTDSGNRGVFDSIEVFKDYAGRDRVVHARRRLKRSKP